MKIMTPQEARQLNPLVLAYVGDGIYELLTRCRMIEHTGALVGRLHLETVAVVRASAQSAAYETIREFLTEEETTIFKRGRNANGNQVPRNGNPAEYRRATGLEALFGYLYLTGQIGRLEELYQKITAAEEHPQEECKKT